MDFVYQGVLLVVDLLAIVAVGARPSAVRWYWLPVGIVMGVLVALPLTRDPFHGMRLASWLLFLHLPVVALSIAFLVWRRRRALASWAVMIAVVPAAVGVDAFLIEPHALQVSKYEIVSPRVQERTRIAVVADLQTDAVGDYEDEALRRVEEEAPDLILFLGDYLQVHRTRYDAEAERFRQMLGAHQGLEAPLGAFAVSGNIEDHKPWPRLFSGSAVTTVTRTRSVRLNEWLTITGLDSDDSFDTDLRVARSDDEFHVVFGHAPDFALGNIDGDLLLAGHTHGGQVRVPFVGPLLTLSKVPRAWASGKTELADGRTLFVSRGVGMERGTAPRIRFLCRPEIIIIDLLPSAAT